MERWDRARLFAQLSGFLHSEESHTGANLRASGVSSEGLRAGLPMRVNDGRIEELELRQFDIYTLEYFLYAFSLIKKACGGKLIESTEGHTWMH